MARRTPAHLLGVPHHTAFNHWGNAFLSHLRNRGGDPSRSIGIELKDNTSTRP